MDEVKLKCRPMTKLDECMKNPEFAKAYAEEWARCDHQDRVRVLREALEWIAEHGDATELEFEETRIPWNPKTIAEIARAALNSTAQEGVK